MGGNRRAISASGPGALENRKRSEREQKKIVTRSGESIIIVKKWLSCALLIYTNLQTSNKYYI